MEACVTNEAGNGISPDFRRTLNRNLVYSTLPRAKLEMSFAKCKRITNMQGLAEKPSSEELIRIHRAAPHFLSRPETSRLKSAETTHGLQEKLLKRGAFALYKESVATSLQEVETIRRVGYARPSSRCKHGVVVRLRIRLFLVSTSGETPHHGRTMSCDEPQHAGGPCR
ncbi:hypothetical protein Bbelb_231850 [Branchiostoma belcheri]|nr:hypothetical protein Bbelb_231850 [Branchiostoma belcheri]